MSTAVLIKELERYEASDEAERAALERLRSFSQAHPDCCDRSLQEGHITGSAWLINPKGDKVCLHFHKKLQMWMQFGGHADGNPDVLAVAIREAEEESGIGGILPVMPEIFDVDVHAIPARPAEVAHFHYDVRYLLQAPHENFVCSAESEKLAWFKYEELKQVNLEESVWRMARKWKQLTHKDYL